MPRLRDIAPRALLLAAILLQPPAWASPIEGAPRLCWHAPGVSARVEPLPGGGYRLVLEGSVEGPVRLLLNGSTDITGLARESGGEGATVLEVPPGLLPPRGSHVVLGPRGRLAVVAWSCAGPGGSGLKAPPPPRESAKSGARVNTAGPGWLLPAALWVLAALAVVAEYGRGGGRGGGAQER